MTAAAQLEALGNEVVRVAVQEFRRYQEAHHPVAHKESGARAAMNERDARRFEADLRSWVPARLKYFAGPEPGGIANTIGNLTSVRNILSETAIDKCADVKALLANWDGQSGTTFNDEFLPRLPHSIHNQAELVWEMKRVLEAAHDVTDRIRSQAHQLGRNTLTILKQDDGGEFEQLLDIAAALVAVGTAAVTSGASEVVFFAWLAAGVSTAGAAKSLSVQGSNPYEIMQSFNTQLTKLDEVATGVDIALSQQLKADLKRVNDFREESFMPPYVGPTG